VALAEPTRGAYGGPRVKSSDDGRFSPDMSAEERTRQLLLLLLLLLQDLLLKAANEADCLINEREGGKFSPPLRQRP